MKKKLYLILSMAFIFSLMFGLFLNVQTVQAMDSSGRGGPNGSGTGNQTTPGAGSRPVDAGSGNGTGMGLVPLSTEEAAGLQAAILEEYGALNLYNAIMVQFGDVYPFNQIAASEQQHATALIRQAEKYGVEVPVNPGIGTAPVFASLSDACAAGVAAEIADAALYDELKLVTTHTDLLRVYNQLQSASLNQHLPAFTACQ